MQFVSAFATDIGRKRSQNQDNGAAHPELGLFVVADGMGGHRGGETASALAVETISTVVAEKLKASKNPDPREVLVEAIESANARIHQTSARDPKLQGMGTTATALLFSENRVTIGHVGDSRCYLLQPGAIWQLTRDHSLVQEKLRAGLISRDQLKTDRLKNVITRSVGFESHVNVETYEMEIPLGGAFLVCSDGLSGLIDDAQILETAQDRVFQQGDFEGAAHYLVEAANDIGGDDNITVILVQVK